MPSRTEVRPPASRPSLLGSAVAVVVVAGALAVAAAVVGEPGDAGGTLSVGLPGGAVVLGADALTGALLGAGVVVVVLAVWALATSPHRRIEARRPWWHTVTMLVLLAALSLLLSWSMARGWLTGGFALFARDPAGIGGASEVDPLAGPGAGAQALDPALRQGAAVVGVVIVLLASAVAAWWWLYRAGDSEPETGPEDEGTERLAAAVDAALYDLDAGIDPRTAILRCYAHLEAALAASGVPRRMAETAREHRHRAAGTLGPAARAAAGLVDRFERARYDAAPVSEAQRQEAEAALRDVRAALQHRPAPQRPAPQRQALQRLRPPLDGSQP